MTRENENVNSEADRVRELAAERDDKDPTGVREDVLADRVEQQAVIEAAEEAEQLAESVLLPADLRRMHQEELSAAEYLYEHLGVNVLEYNSEGALFEAGPRPARRRLR